VRDDGTAWCWGDNFFGQLGDGTTTRRITPTQVGTETDWVTVTAASTHTCGVRADGSAWCWGDN
jgi:alpha-tubulin suppressor-like RCC1 family protein